LLPWTCRTPGKAPEVDIFDRHGQTSVPPLPSCSKTDNALHEQIARDALSALVQAGLVLDRKGRAERKQSGAARPVRMVYVNKPFHASAIILSGCSVQSSLSRAWMSAFEISWLEAISLFFDSS
jgi:hypothetical protein